MGVPDHVMESITGHLSRRMLEHYSHIRMDAKRAALAALDVYRAEAANGQNSVALEGATSTRSPSWCSWAKKADGWEEAT